MLFNPVALRKTKSVHNFGLFECNRVKKKLFQDPVVSIKNCISWKRASRPEKQNYSATLVSLIIETSTKP